MAEEKLIMDADAGTDIRSHMTEAQAKAYDEFIDYMVELYREFSYLTEDDEEQETGEPVR